MIIFLFILLSLSFTQVVPYESTSIKINSQNYSSLLIKDSMIDELVNINIDVHSHSIVIDNNRYIELPITLETLRTIKIKLIHSNIPNGSRFFLIDLDDNDLIGPFYASGNSIELGAINTSNFILQCIIPQLDKVHNANFVIEKIYDLSKVSIDKKQRYYPADRDNRENPIIVVTGFWPPTNEMIRHFSQDLDLNPSGWQGEDWQGLGYDIISFFPEFDDPDCDDCGQGYGDFEVDYQDTSHDFWTIIDEINPVTIITFSRGFIDFSWELEFNFYNRTNWYADYTTPFFPTPNPPDTDESVNFLRNSTLPMEEIMNAVNEANLGLNSYIDSNGDPGHYVSEFMGYHGVWYHDLYQYESENPCYLAGHVHVGGLIDWDTSREATEITISKVIESLEEYIYIPGDASDDGNVDILDLVTVVSHILGQQTLTGGAFYAADMNSNGIINIQDIILIINLILI